MTSSENGNHQIVLYMAYLCLYLIITFLLLEKWSQPSYSNKMCRSGKILHLYILLLLKVFALSLDCESNNDVLNLDTILLKQFANVICKSLTHLFNLSLDSKIIPVSGS